jgi:hypothetical protein
MGLNIFGMSKPGPALARHSGCKIMALRKAIILSERMRRAVFRLA